MTAKAKTVVPVYIEKASVGAMMAPVDREIIEQASAKIATTGPLLKAPKHAGGLDG